MKTVSFASMLAVASAAILSGWNPAAAEESAALPADTAAPLGNVPVENPSPPPSAAEQQAAPRSRLVEEIVVTANRREENLQDVPQSVAAFSAEKLEAIGIKTVQDLPNVTPGLTITNQAGWNMAFIRGVGTDAFLPGADLSVPFYIDGIPLLSAQGSQDNLGKIDRVEVLKGPQGTLFGTNAVGGAINIVTPKPGREFEGEVQWGYGNYDAQSALAYLNIPMFDNLAATLSAYGNRQDNFYTNDSGPVIDIYSYGGRLKMVWDVSDTISNTVTASYDKTSNNSGLTFENILPSPRVGGVSVVPPDPSLDRHVSFENFSVGALNHSWLLSDALEFALQRVNIKVIGSAQKLVADGVDATFGAGDLVLAHQESPNSQYTGELQFLSTDDTPWSDRLTWVAGLFYYKSKGGLSPFDFIVAPGLVNAYPGVNIPLITRVNELVAPITELAGIRAEDGIILRTTGVLEADSISGYAQGTLAVTDALNLILGARYQKTTKDLVKSQTTTPTAGGAEVLLIRDEVPKLTAKQFSPRVGLQYRLDDRTQVYASWARGYKTPTYNTVNLLGSLPGPINPVKAQRNDAYELGVKSDIFENTLRVNAAAFYTKQKDVLTGTVQVLSGGVVNYDNAPGARIYGAEADTVWTPFPVLNPGMALTFAICYLDTKYTDYPNGRGFDEETGLTFGPGAVLPLLPARDFTGNEIPRTPDLSYTVGIGQTVETGNGTIELGMDGSYNDGFWFSAQNIDIEAAEHFFLLNAHISYDYNPWDVQISFWGRNLTNTDYSQIIFIDDFGRNNVLNDPRTYGLRLTWRF